MQYKYKCDMCKRVYTREYKVLKPLLHMECECGCKARRMNSRPNEVYMAGGYFSVDETSIVSQE